MKKLLVIGSLAIFICMPASAQLTWGIRGGLNLVNNKITDVTQESLLKKDSYTGFFFGPMTEFQIPIIGIGVDASLLYSQKGLELAKGEEIKNQALSVPVSLKYTFGLGNFLGIFAHAGPQFDYKLGNLESSFDDIESVKYELKQSTWSFNLGAGVKLIKHIQAAVNYNIPLTKEGNIFQAADAARQNPEAFETSTLQFILTWTF
ncbi:MAG TPA: porin family protein [Bacteroidaceae bacterium]|nr:porin family protein [Bacteroidaceae bacterium]